MEIHHNEDNSLLAKVKQSLDEYNDDAVVQACDDEILGKRVL